MRIDKTTLKKQSGLYTDHPMVETYSGFSGNSVTNIARDCLVSGVIVEAEEDMLTDYDDTDGTTKNATSYDAAPIYSNDDLGNSIPVIRPKGIDVLQGERGILGETHDKIDTFIPFHLSVDYADNNAIINQGVGDGETADSSNWAIEDNRTKGLELTIVTRVDYYNAGNETLYGYERVLEFNENGHLVNVSSENRVAIDVTEEC